MSLLAPRKPVHFVASSLKDLQALPGAVQDDFGRWLLDVQYGDTPAVAKPLKSGVATPQQEIELVRRRFEIARQHYQQHYGAAEAQE